MRQVSTREMLQELANQPIGGAGLQKNPLDENGKIRPEIKETAQRIMKLWLPQGKRPAHPRGACNVPDAEQIDIEDAVEAAGGKRGGK